MFLLRFEVRVEEGNYAAASVLRRGIVVTDSHNLQHFEQNALLVIKERMPGIMSLEALEFIRRFLLHVLPVGFVKIRHFGFLANRNRAQALRLCRQHLPSSAHDRPLAELLTPEQRQAMEHRCPYCRQGTLHIVALLSAEELMIYMHPAAVDSIDSS